MISYCLTMKNRTGFMRRHIKNLLWQTYPTKNIELCVSDGDTQSDELKNMLMEYKDYFGRIIYCKSDRGMLPITIPSNNPVCDKNSLIANIASSQQCILIDPEVIWAEKDGIEDTINKIQNEKQHMSIPCYMGNEAYSHNDGDDIKRENTFGIYYGNGFCLCFFKKTFIEYRGFEERFAKGFACDDTYFCDTWRIHLNEIKSEKHVIHTWHGNQHLEEKNKELLKINLATAGEMNCRLANFDNSEWQRPEMIKNREIL